jgi:cytidylate kinase
MRPERNPNLVLLTSAFDQSPPVIVAIDGPAGAGKSTIARLLAARLGLPYLDTGAMYRVVGLLADRRGIAPPFDDQERAELERLVSDHEIVFEPDFERGNVVLLDGEDVSEAIRTPEISTMASAVSAVSEVRSALVPMQREIGKKNGGVMEGRDIGSVVFPEADLKIFLTASPSARARRRFEDLKNTDSQIPLAEVERLQQERDLQDTSRVDSPLHVSRGSVVVDTTEMTPAEVVQRLVEELEKRRGSLLDTTRENTVRSRNHGS